MHFGFELSPAADRMFDTVELGIAVLGGLWGVFTGFRWVKDIREKDLRNIKNDVNQAREDVVSVRDEIVKQTSIISDGFANLQAATTRELGELRSDFRTFYTAPDPMMVPVRSRTVRKRNSVAARMEAKAKPKARTKRKSAK